jgi:Tfp pilus assembly protein PilN
MNIRLNLATAPLESNRRFAVGAVAVGAVGLVAMLLLSWHVYGVWRADKVFRARQAQLAADTDRLRAERRDLDLFFNQPDNIQRRDLAAFLNGLIVQRAFPWTKIFADLEHSLPDGVRVVSIEPQLKGDHVELRLTVGASSDEGGLKFLRALEDSTEFSEIEVLNEARSSGNADADRVLVALQARYSGY